MSDARLSGLVSRLSLRAFTTKDGSGNNSDSTEDPFGVHFQDSAGQDSGNGNIGPKDSLPPNYIRDSATGKFTGEIQAQVSNEEKTLLNLGPIAKERLLSKKFEQSLIDDSDDSNSHSMASVARRIREEETAFNTFGRKVTDVAEALSLDNNQHDDEHANANAAPLSPDELESLRRFMQKTSSDKDEATQRLMDETDNLIPTVARMSTNKSASNETNDENPDLDLEWMTISAQRSMTDLDTEDLEDPFSNLMPSDLNPAKKVNRRRAKPIPTQLLHHNNLSLLRRYVTPGGQIMNRVQSRLGAKDQRKIAKLVKRARHLGLIPVLGQWKFEDHGNVKDTSIYEDTDWEKRLLERGLVERKSALWEKSKTTDADGHKRSTW